VSEPHLTEVTIAVLGGDEREQVIARLAAASGATVRGYGFPWPDAGIVGVAHTLSAEDALDGADYALLPIPGMSADGSIYAPHAPTPIVPDVELLGHLNAGASIILGTADAALRTSAASLGQTVIEYESDKELMLLRGPAIVEGAIGIAISNTAVTIHGATVGVVGHGTIGRLLARELIALSAHVHVFARSGVQRAEAYSAGSEPHPLEELAAMAPVLDMLFSTASAPVVGPSILSRFAKGTLIMDLSAPPGSVDLSAATELGLRAIWARGLGRRAPLTVGRSQWQGILRRIVEQEEKRENES
jgi:dipicolinate synthase subunit A